jgi:hypothetical protein
MGRGEVGGGGSWRQASIPASLSHRPSAPGGVRPTDDPHRFCNRHQRRVIEAAPTLTPDA